MKHPSQYDICPDCQGPKTKVSIRCLACASNLRRVSPERRVEARRQKGRRFYKRHRDEIIAAKTKWFHEHPEYKRAADRLYYERHVAQHLAQTNAWGIANPEKVVAAKKKWLEANPEKRREVMRRYRARAGSRVAEVRRRRARKAGVLLIVQVDADYCGVCLGPLVPGPVHPDPMATTVGHEPPLFVAARDGWKIVVERPEHSICNLRKNIKTDAELVSWAS